MKKLSLVIALAGVLAVPALQAAMLVTPTTGASFSSGNGGEFRATVGGTLGASVIWSSYVDSAVNGTRIGTASFQTFCLEHGETFSPGGEYEVALNNGAVYGNGGGNGSYDALSKGAAYLYSQFANGSLSGYTYAYGATRATAAGELQEAIWWLEGEAGGVMSANMSTILTAEFGATQANWTADAAAWEYGVGVMNLWDKGYVGVQGHQHQDMLVAVPEPTTMIAGALLLLPFAASTIRQVPQELIESLDPFFTRPYG